MAKSISPFKIEAIFESVSIFGKFFYLPDKTARRRARNPAGQNEIPIDAARGGKPRAEIFADFKCRIYANVARQKIVQRARNVLRGNRLNRTKKFAACPRACTPESVRPLPCKSIFCEKSFCSARSTSPCTVRISRTSLLASCLCHPQKSVPSYEIVRKMFRAIILQVAQVAGFGKDFCQLVVKISRMLQESDRAFL